jgi:biopolymer transport protein ExbD
MAEWNTSPNGLNNGPGVKKGKKLSTRVDLTPMVDLGFLLITFFIFTTTMSQPRIMKLFLPKDVNDYEKQPLTVSNVLTIMLGKNDQLYYYERDDPAKMKTSNFKGIRDVILDKKRRTDPAYFEIILKPSQEATYENTVDVLDEMAIDAINYFALVDISQEEYTIIRSKEQ